MESVWTAHHQSSKGKYDVTAIPTVHRSGETSCRSSVTSNDGQLVTATYERTSLGQCLTTHDDTRQEDTTPRYAKGPYCTGATSGSHLSGCLKLVLLYHHMPCVRASADFPMSCAIRRGGAVPVTDDAGFRCSVRRCTLP